MNRRTTESPMDFEWQNHGPADHTSPFHQLTVKYQQQQLNEKQHGQKRPYTVFDSPSKQQASAPEPPSQAGFSFCPPLPARSYPAFPPAVQSFMTPRKLFEVDVPSSGPESPENNADGEDTPDRYARMALVIRKDDDGPVDDDKLASPVKEKNGRGAAEKKPGLFDGHHGKAKTPGRGDVLRGRPSERRVQKKAARRHVDVDRDREREMRHQNHRSHETEESDAAAAGHGRENRKRDRDRHRSSHPKDKHPSSSSSSFIPSLFTYLESHPDLPHILSYYAQFFLNVFLVFFFIYIIYSFWSTIRSDVDKKSDLVAAETLAEMAACAHQYVENRCDRATRVPAMESVCDSWERCMKKDPSQVGRARVSAHTFAEIFNSFVEPISYKAMFFSLVMVFGCVAISNFAFGFFRARTQPFMLHHHQQHAAALAHPQLQQLHPMISSPAGAAPTASGSAAGYLSSPPPPPQHDHRQYQRRTQGYYPPYNTPRHHQPVPSSAPGYGIAETPHHEDMDASDL
ncbi:MAG: hypothetical protein M1816_000425 [Peltula sp. TS41687]|nr:MAG: hypothetical protein M1816_000425 [Peltula sp. TS41687]